MNSARDRTRSNRCGSVSAAGGGVEIGLMMVGLLVTKFLGGNDSLARLFRRERTQCPRWWRESPRIIAGIASMVAWSFLKLVISVKWICCDNGSSGFIVDISSAIFHFSAPDLDSCPDESLPQFAFIGRSNVGKSSLLNLLAGKEALARVSPTPGFTKLINIFTMNKTWRLVDLPGSGSDQVARQDSARFNQAVARYLKHRKNLCCVFALLDSGLPPQEIDLEFLEWLTRNSVPFVLVFTKTDRVPPEPAQANIAAFSAHISTWL